LLCWLRLLKARPAPAPAGHQGQRRHL